MISMEASSDDWKNDIDPEFDPYLTKNSGKRRS